MSKVLTVGTFDMPHSGHINLFKKCRKLSYSDTSSGEVFVGVNSDQFVNKYKGSFPVYPYEERVAIINEFIDVDEIIKNDEVSLASMLINILPDFLVVGSDWAKKDYYAQIGVSESWLQEYGIMLIYVPYTENISTTVLKERLLAQ